MQLLQKQPDGAAAYNPVADRCRWTKSTGKPAHPISFLFPALSVRERRKEFRRPSSFLPVRRWHGVPVRSLSSDNGSDTSENQPTQSPNVLFGQQSWHVPVHAMTWWWCPGSGYRKVPHPSRSSAFLYFADNPLFLHWKYFADIPQRCVYLCPSSLCLW